MDTITITIPKKILAGRTSGRRLVVVDPKEFEKDLRRRMGGKRCVGGRPGDGTGKEAG